MLDVSWAMIAEFVILLAWSAILAVSCFQWGREYERKQRYHPPIGTPGALQEQLHAIKAGGR